MDSIMLIEATYICKLFVADITDRFVTCVRQVMFLKSLRIRKQFIANIALVGVLTSMDEVVTFEVSSLGKASIANATDIRLLTSVNDVMVF